MRLSGPQDQDHRVPFFSPLFLGKQEKGLARPRARSESVVRTQTGVRNGPLWPEGCAKDVGAVLADVWFRAPQRMGGSCVIALVARESIFLLVQENRRKEDTPVPWPCGPDRRGLHPRRSASRTRDCGRVGSTRRRVAANLWPASLPARPCNPSLARQGAQGESALRCHAGALEGFQSLGAPCPAHLRRRQPLRRQFRLETT